jgi:hypothetical protein
MIKKTLSTISTVRRILSGRLKNFVISAFTSLLLSETSRQPGGAGAPAEIDGPSDEKQYHAAFAEPAR